MAEMLYCSFCVSDVPYVFPCSAFLSFPCSWPFIVPADPLFFLMLDLAAVEGGLFICTEYEREGSQGTNALPS